VWGEDSLTKLHFHREMSGEVVGLRWGEDLSRADDHQEVEFVYSEVLPGQTGEAAHHILYTWIRELPLILAKHGLTRVSAEIAANQLLYHSKLKINPHINTILLSLEALCNTKNSDSGDLSNSTNPLRTQFHLNLAFVDKRSDPTAIPDEIRLADAKNHNAQRTWAGWIGSMAYFAVKYVVYDAIISRFIWAPKLLPNQFVVFPQVVEQEVEKIAQILHGNSSGALRSESIFPESQVFDAFLQTREDSLKKRPLHALKAEFGAIISYSCHLVSFKVVNSYFVKFGTSRGTLPLCLDSVDIAVATLKLAISSCREAYSSLVKRKAASERMKTARRGYVQKLHNCLQLLSKLDDLEINQRLMEANAKTAQALKDTLPDMDEVVKTTDELAEQLANAAEVDQLLSEPLPSDMDLIDDDDVLQELERLEGELMEKHYLPPVESKSQVEDIKFPEVPVTNKEEVKEAEKEILLS
jgi:hypothetical protein